MVFTHLNPVQCQSLAMCNIFDKGWKKEIIALGGPVKGFKDQCGLSNVAFCWLLRGTKERV